MSRSTVLVSVLCVLLLAGSAWAVKVPNSSFEDDGSKNTWVTSMTDWTLIPPVTAPPTTYRAGLFYNFDGFTATNQNEFAIITHRNQGTQSLTSQSIVLGHLEQFIEFDYVYVSKNAPGDATHIDPFTVIMWSGATQLASWTVSDTNDSNLALGTISSVPFAPSGSMQNTYDTGWQTFTVDIEQYVGNTVTLEFRLTDSAQQGGGTGFFLDRIRVAPEPGTFLLFGVGAFGLMLYGRRKIRRRK